jgi:hypothetical protein
LSNVEFFLKIRLLDFAGFRPQSVFSEPEGVPFHPVLSVMVSGKSILRVNDEFFVHECADMCSQYIYPIQNRHREIEASVSITLHPGGRSMRTKEASPSLAGF